MTITITEDDNGYEGIAHVGSVTVKLKECETVEEVVRPIMFALCTMGWEHESVVEATRKWAAENTPEAP
jgi:hypothetical protein